ncbi:MAG TPA: hypothetical protein VHK67_06170 [Rhabdochlamydiaceae bacterium]|nr:hypothetical protein [Rhabdochlamydiaceae bacterium]
MNKKNLLSALKKEVHHVILIFLFFLVFFNLINWTEAFLFKRNGITPFGFLEVAIAAGLIAKIILVVDHLQLIRLFRTKPLAVSILWKTAIYWILLLIVRLAIRFTPYLFKVDGDFSEDLALFIDQVNWNLFISIQVYYLMLLFIFVTFRELTYKIGPVKMRRLFFGK